MIYLTRSFHFLKLAALVLPMLVSPCAVLAATLIVPAQHPTIQGALNVAQNGDTVLVQPGVYSGSILRFSGKAIHLKSANGPTVTTIRGDGSNPVFHLVLGEKRTTIIEGFTITNGIASSGGGMLLNGVSPVVRGNIFTGNRATGTSGNGGRGGAIWVANVLANPLIVDNIFTNNEAAAHGGAIQTSNFAIADIRNNTFTSNRAVTGSGGAIQSLGGIATVTTPTMTIVGNTFNQNTSVFAGGAISIFATSALITDNTIANNDGGVFGGGIHLETQAVFGNRAYIIKNNRIEGNKATAVGAGLHTYMENTFSSVDVSHNVIIGNTCENPACVLSNQNTCGRGGGSET